MSTTIYWKRRVFQSEINIVGIICNGLIHKEPKQKVLKDIKKEITHIYRAIKLNSKEYSYLWEASKRQYELLSKKTYGKLREIDRKFGKKEDYKIALGNRKDAVYSTVKKYLIRNDQMTKVRNQVAYSYENRAKVDGLTELLEENRQKSPFFLCSTHKNPAEDHKDWEGKMYFDADWADQDWSDEDRARIAAYIRNHDLKTVQWVTGEPVYLITRPNCKHYLVNIPIQDVLKSSVKALLRNKKMYMKDDVPASPERLAYRRYYERLKTEKSLNQLIDSEQLAKDISRTERLVTKYARLLNQEKNGSQ